MSENITMQREHRGRRSIAMGALLVVASLAGCRSADLDTQAFEDSRELYLATRETPQIFDYATSSLRQAKSHLQRAEELLDGSASQDEVDHHCFIARQHLAIAEARLRHGLAREELALAEQRRHTLMLQSQQRQAASASRRAEEIEDQLSDTRIKLEMAEQRARALAEKLVQLEGNSGGR